jgi:WD40 repeat protein
MSFTRIQEGKNMKKIVVVFFFIIITLILQANEIEDTLLQIEALKKEITQNEDLVEQKIADLKKTNPLFSDQSPFESDMEFLGRMSRAMPQIRQIRKKYLDDLWQKMSILRGRLFETQNIAVVLDSDKYDPNTEEWKIIVDHFDYQKEHHEVVIKIDRVNAGVLFKNKDKLLYTGILAVDIGDKIGLAKFRISDPISKYELEYEFRPMLSLKHGASVSFSTDGKYLATGSGFNAYIFNLETGNEVKSFKHRYSVYSVSFSPDGKYLATGSSDNNARIFNLDTGNEVKSFKHRDDVYSVSFSPDGKYLATGSGYNAHIFNLETGNEVKSFDHRDYVYSVSFSPDGKYLATGSFDNNAHIFNLETGNEVKSFEHRHDVYSVSFSPDGKYLATGSNDKNARIFNLETGNEVKSFKHEGSVSSVAFSPDGKYLATGSNDKNARIFNLDTGNEVKSFKHEESVKSVSFSPDGKYLAVGCSDDYAYIYRTLIQVEDEVLAKKAISRPPALSVSVSFEDTDGNKFLNALEKGVFHLNITNQGEGAGKGILVKFNPGRIENLNYNNTFIEEIEAGKTAEIDIPIEAYIEIENADHLIRFDFEEINGFPPDPVEIQISTKSFKKPEIFIVDTGIEDGNSNGMIESGEMINLTVRIGNKGKGTGTGAYAKFYTGDNVFITDTYPKTVKLGDIEYNDQIDVPLEFFVNDKADDNIALYVDFTEATGLAGVDKLRLPIKKSERARTIQKTVVSGIEKEYGELAYEADLSVDIEHNIPIGKENKEAIAVVIGNSDYQKTKQVDFAMRDAALMKQYLISAFGLKEGNIFIINNATKGDFETYFGTDNNHRGKLYNSVKNSVTDVIIYYSGHGAPSIKDQKGYFVPVECDPQYVELGGYSIDTFYNNLSEIPAKSMTVILDACFSGAELLENISPIILDIDNPLISLENGVIISSSQSDQPSSWYNKMKHGMFTYFFLKAIHNENADFDNSGDISYNEIFLFVSDSNEGVPYYSRRLHGFEQNPQLSGQDTGKAAVKYQY